MTQSYLPIDGACHCGNIQFSLAWPGTDSTIPVRMCSCTFCRKHAGSWTSHPDAKLVVQIGDPTKLSRYQFGTKTAEFYLCSACGVLTFATSSIDDILYAVVNVTALEGADSLSFCRSKTDFDGEDIASRLGRRQANWIADVRINELTN